MAWTPVIQGTYTCDVHNILHIQQLQKNCGDRDQSYYHDHHILLILVLTSYNPVN